jgi:hypothetical protein
MTHELCALLFLSETLHGSGTIKLKDIIMFTDKRQAEKGKFRPVRSAGKNKGIGDTDPLSAVRK